MKLFQLAVASLCLISCSPELPHSGPSLPEAVLPDDPAPAPEAEPEVSIWVPRADKGQAEGVHFEGEQLEMLTWGPKTFHIDFDGSFWIADTVVEQLLHLNRQGEVLGVIDLSATSIGSVMVDFNQDELAVISAASQPPRAVRYRRNGEFITAYDLPLEWRGSLSGIDLSDDGVITVERESGYRRYSIEVADDGSYELLPDRSLTWDLSEPSEFDQLVIRPVDSRNVISLRRFMGTWNDLFYVYAEEWRQDEYGRAVVDATVRMFNDEAEQLGLARVPIRERYTFVDLGGVQYDALTDQMLVMMTQPDGVTIAPLEFVDQLAPLADWGKPEGWDPGPKDGALPQQSLVCWSSMDSVVGQMLMNAYSGSNVQPNSAGCTGRTIPSYILGNAFFGVPYSWGDCDNHTEFDNFMDTANGTNNYKAGDADGTLTSPSSCSRGTDCSGLVTRAWGYSCPGGKLSTTSIATPTYTTVDTGSWNAGEVYNLAGSHVVIYYGLQSGSNYYWYEATVDLNYDAVVRSTHPMSYYSGYTHRRFVNQCP